MKRAGGGTTGGRRGPEDTGGKVEKQDLWDELRRLLETTEVFSPVDISVKIGASESAVSKALLVLVFERLLDKVDANHYKFSASFREVGQAEFVRALNAKVDGKRQQDMLEIERLKKNNDEMRRRLQGAAAERDRYLALLKQHGIDPGPPPAETPAAAPAPAVPAQAAPADAAPGGAAPAESGLAPGPGDADHSV
jgi:hypothetical protein